MRRFICFFTVLSVSIMFSHAYIIAQPTATNHDYYTLAANLLKTYNSGDARITDESGRNVNAQRLLYYTSILLPRQSVLYRKEWTNVKNELVKVEYWLEHPLTIDKDFMIAKDILENAVDEIIEPWMSDREKALLIHDWVAANNRYPLHQITDNSDERSAAALAFNGNAVCTGISDAFKIMCDYAGLPCINVFGSGAVTPVQWTGHQWNAVYIDGKWLYVDVTFNAADYRSLSHKYFLVNDDAFFMDHAFDSGLSQFEQLEFADWALENGIISFNKITQESKPGPVDCTVYNINGLNYFKLRDLAYILKDTGSSFDIEWTGNEIILMPGKATTIERTDDKADLYHANAQPTSHRIFINGARKSLFENLTVYNIDGYNYFNLRELAYGLNNTASKFNVVWDVSANAAVIVTGEAYTGGTPVLTDRTKAFSAVLSSQNIVIE